MSNSGTAGSVLREPLASEVAQLARIWYDGWQDAHARILPAALARVRTLDSFAQRLAAALPRVRVAALPEGPVGFCLVEGDELNQLFVSAAARGSGVAAALVRDAEARLWTSGVRLAWLSCAIGNERAARFYEKSGWLRSAAVTEQLAVPTGSFALEVWRYEKRLQAPQPAA